MKISIKIIHYLNIAIITTALGFLIERDYNPMLFLIIPGFLQPFLAFVLLASRRCINENSYKFIIWYWVGVALSLLTLPIYGFGIFIGIFLIFFFGFVTYKFQKNNYK